MVLTKSKDAVGFMLGSLSQQVGNSLVASKVADTIRAVLASPAPAQTLAGAVGALGASWAPVLGCLAVFCPSTLRTWTNVRASARQHSECRELLGRVASTLERFDSGGMDELLAIADRHAPVWARLGGADQAELARRIRAEIESLLTDAGIANEETLESLATIGFDSNERLRCIEASTQAILERLDPLSGGKALGEWRIVERWRWQDALNGVQFRQVRLRHATLDRFARGKCYDLASVRGWPPDAVEASLRRHAEVLNRTGAQPNLPALLSAFELPSEGQFWIIEAWAGDETLAERIERRPLDRAETRTVLRGLLDGLAALHGADVIRRDLHPRTIVLRPGSHVPVLTDLELCKVLGHPTTVAPRGGWRDDPFLAPEVRARAPSIGPEADFYSLAACGIACLLGSTEISNDPAALREFASSHLPAPMAALCAIRPADRTCNLKALRRALEQWS